MDVIDDDENLQCEDCRFAPDLIPMDNGNKYLCIVCGRIYDTELGDIAKHHMQLRSEVDDVMIAESSEPMIVNFADQYYAAKTNDNDDNNDIQQQHIGFMLLLDKKLIVYDNEIFFG